MNSKQPLPTWLLCVWVTPGFGTCYQIDMVDAAGENHGSTNPEALKARGYELPDFTGLAHGQYQLGAPMQRAGGRAIPVSSADVLSFADEVQLGYNPEGQRYTATHYPQRVNASELLRKADIVEHCCEILRRHSRSELAKEARA